MMLAKREVKTHDPADKDINCSCLMARFPSDDDKHDTRPSYVLCPLILIHGS